MSFRSEILTSQEIPLYAIKVGLIVWICLMYIMWKKGNYLSELFKIILLLYFTKCNCLFSHYKSEFAINWCAYYYESTTLPLLSTTTKTKYWLDTVQRPSCIQQTNFFKAWYKNWRTLLIRSNSNTEATSSTFTYNPKCMVLDQTVWNLNAKTAKFHTVDLENKGQGHLRLSEVRWPNDPHWFDL